MELSNDLVSQFAKIANGNDKKKETTIYGTVVKYGGEDYVKIDGSELLTPITSTAAVKDGERVTVSIKNHSATVTGNISSPSASDKDVQNLNGKIQEFDTVIADKVSTKELEAERGRIDSLVSDNIIVKEKLTANEAEIDTLKANDIVVNGKIEANKALIDDLETKKLSAEVADIKYASVENLDATKAKIHDLEADYGDFKALSADKFSANEAKIKDLEAKKLSATDADIKYANIDFSNIGKAAMEHFYANSGLIKDVIIDEGTITGNLVGVTIKGDLIEGGTVVADKLVIKGADGLYYKLNTNGVTTETEQTDYNSLNGSIITAKSITATKIAVEDLVAFDATIGGFNITSDSLYSGVKESVDNTTRGIYLDKNGQMAIGDSNQFIKYYRVSDGSYKLAISAESITFEAGKKNLNETIDEIKENAVKIVKVEYSLSESSTTPPTSGWSIVAPEWVNGKYMWQKTTLIMANGVEKSSNPICISGAVGPQGSTGNTGATGKGISSVSVEFYLSTSKTSQTGGSWSSTMPTWSSGKYLWTRNKIVYINPSSTIYTTPICDSSWEAVNEVDVGGTNLLVNTLNPVISPTDERIAIIGQTTDSGLTAYSTSSHEITEHGYKIIISKDGASYPYFRLGANPTATSGGSLNGLKAGQTYTISCDVMFKLYSLNTSGTTQKFGIHYFDDSEKTGTFKIKKYTHMNANDGVDYNTWSPISLTFTVGEKATMLCITIAPYANTNAYFSAGDYIAFRNLKLEKGNKATDWSPAPNDLKKDYDDKIADNINDLRNAIQTKLDLLDDAIEAVVKEDYYTKGDAEDFIESKISKVRQTADDLTISFKNFKSDIDMANKKVDSLDAYFRFDSAGYLHIGKNDSNFELVLSNEKISFLDSGNEVAYIEKQKLYINDGEFLGKLIIGKYAFVPRDNGSLDFKKVR